MIKSAHRLRFGMAAAAIVAGCTLAMTSTPRASAASAGLTPLSSLVLTGESVVPNSVRAGNGYVSQTVIRTSKVVSQRIKSLVLRTARHDEAAPYGVALPNN